MSHTETP